MKMVIVFLMLFQCNQQTAQFNIVSVLLSIIFKHDLKKLLNSLDLFFLLNVSGTKTTFAFINMRVNWVEAQYA